VAPTVVKGQRPLTTVGPRLNNREEGPRVAPLQVLEVYLLQTWILYAVVSLDTPVAASFTHPSCRCRPSCSHHTPFRDQFFFRLANRYIAPPPPNHPGRLPSSSLGSPPEPQLLILSPGRKHGTCLSDHRAPRFPSAPPPFHCPGLAVVTTTRPSHTP
jgi:hypothetical protein